MDDKAEFASGPEAEPGVDGTPAWCYDEDGYCIRCGNGRWKHHMPDCELRDLLDAREYARNLTERPAALMPDYSGLSGRRVGSEKDPYP